MKIIKLSVCLLVLCFTVGCKKSSCIKCTSVNENQDDLEYCEDSDINYTDQDGNLVEYKDFAEYAESLGYDCK